MDNRSSNSSKTIGIIIIVLIIIAGVWLMTRKPVPTAVTVSPDTSSTSTTPASTTPAATPTDPGVSAIQAGGNSNAALDAASTSIDTQLSGLSSDNSAAQSNQ